jgi:hypothetical protein
MYGALKKFDGTPPIHPSAGPVSHRFTSVALVALALLSALALGEARAQNDTVLVTVLRPTPVKSAPSTTARTIVIVNPTTFGATQLRVVDGFLRLRVDQIVRRRPSTGQLGYIAVADVDVDSGSAEPAVRPEPPIARSEPPAARPAPPVARAEPARPPAAAPGLPRAEAPSASRTERPTPPRAETASSAAPPGGELVIRPNAPPSIPAAADTPELNFLDKGSLTAIVLSPIAYQIGTGGDSIVVPAGFVADFASVPRALWAELSPVGEHARAVVVHDYLYWFQPCEREEADNLLMIAMTQQGVSDLRRGAVYAGVRLAGEEAWNASGAARDRGELRIVPSGVAPTALESWTDFRTRLGRADIRGTPGRMARQPYCELGKTQEVR